MVKGVSTGYSPSPAPAASHHHGSSVGETITLVAAGALALLVAHFIQYDYPVAAILLRLLPIGLSLYWLFRNVVPKSYYAAPEAVIIDHPVVVSPTYSPWWKPSSWFRSYYHPAPAVPVVVAPPPVVVSGFPPVHPAPPKYFPPVVHAPPTSSTFPKTYHAPAVPSTFPPVAPAKPTYASPLPAPTVPMHTAPAYRGASPAPSFPDVMPFAPTTHFSAPSPGTLHAAPLTR